MNAEALARVLCAVDGIDPDSESTPEPHDPADYAWEAYVEDARRILADPAPLLAALAESGVLTEETVCPMNADPVQAVAEALVEAMGGTIMDAAEAAVAAARPAIEREAKAEAWDEGFADGLRQDGEGADGPRYVNPYRIEREGQA